MEKLRIKIGKKKTVSAMVDEFTIGGTSDHNLLKNREMNNQHPINAIDGLEDALNNRVTNEKLVAEVDSALKSAKESGLFDGKDGEDGHTPQKGIDYFDGEPGNNGIGILSIEQESASSTDGGENIIKITLTDGRVQRFIIKNGSGGEVEISHYDVIEALGYTPIDSADIVDNLETNVVNYPLSAAQGAKLKRLIDDITVPTKTSQLTNDSKFMSTEEVVAKINEAISGVAGGLKFEIVDEVPTGWGDSNTIYLVRSEDTDDNQYYDEYIFIENRGTWEKLGDTKVNLEPYYTGMKVDNLIYNVQKSIPTKMSQLYNDVDYVKASELETGEANWNSIKDYLLEPMEVAITWDGNTEGCEYIEMSLGSNKVPCYKVSNIIVRAAEYGWGNMEITYENGATTSTAPSMAPNEANGKWFDINFGVGCVFDSELSGYPTGIYFFSANFSGNGMPIGLSPIMAEKLKKRYLPDHTHPGGAVDGGTVKSIVFTSATELYNWLENNDTNKVLRVVVYSGSYLDGKKMVFYGVTPMADGDTYYLERITVYTFNANSVTSGYQFISINKGGILNLNSGTFTFNTDGTMSSARDEQLQLNDEAIQYIGANITITYVD